MEDKTNMTTEFEALKEISIKQIEDRLETNLQEIQNREHLISKMRRYNKKYKSNELTKFSNYLIGLADKEKETVIQEITEIEKAPDFSGKFIITVEWTKSKTWGSNPRSYTNHGFESSSIGGCGYDKLSTATAQALNSNKSILKLMYAQKNNILDKSNHELLGYGSGYGLLPAFEGGVGTSSHIKILDNIGLDMKSITSTKHTDVFLITIK